MSVFQQGRNVWHVERAQRASVLIDGAAYFGAVRSALRKARKTIFIIGWDINSRVRLVGESGKADDGLPEELCQFLCALVKRRPELTINILLWDFSILYSTEREIFPSVSLGWNMPSCIRLCLDDALPLGSAHHQKLVVVDDCVAFSGGLDLTVRRWDTSDHSFDNPLRKDASGSSYRPFHDVQMLVNGPAARRIGELARTRWERATFERLPDVHPEEECWPEGIQAHFRDVDIGIALTQPVYDAIPEVRQVEQLFLDAIDRAERHIYIENQFLTRLPIAERITARMRERPELETLIVAPHTHESWIEARTMRTGRINFRRCFEEAGVQDRVRFFYPSVETEAGQIDTMVHSKVMVVDDRFLRVGSANLNNRSMGTDTECDLALEGETPEVRAQIETLRNTLIGEHCGVSASEVATAIVREGSMLRATEILQERGHRMRPIEDGEPDPSDISRGISAVADPERTVGIEEFIHHLVGAKVPYRQVSHVFQVALGCLLVVALTLAWRYTPLSEWTDPRTLRDAAETLSGSYWAPLIVIGVFVVAGFVLFPVTILIAVTAGAFGPVLGLAYAGAGALASAAATYFIGLKLGRDALRRLVGPRLNRISRKVSDKGVLAVAAVRLVPVAPFTVVNLAAGASGIRVTDFLAGTALGLTPGLIVLSTLGDQVFRVLSDPSGADIAMFLVLAMAWIGLSFGAQVAMTKFRKTRA
ncbi:VTT domain-containing protein [Flaviflagellibacter deserti]|uniref:Phospholipase D n=1 Tax=Flaviflagellibacter deserti TaxID=2267266 RepID=A0ABV9Z040_9HYPH